MLKPMTYLRRNFAQCTAGKFETEHAQYERRGILHGSFELGGLVPVDFMLRRRKFTGKCFVNQALARKTFGGVT